MKHTQGDNPMIELRAISEDNFRECLLLRASVENEDFVDPVTYSLAEAWVYYQDTRPFAIYSDDTIVGFVSMYVGEDNYQKHQKQKCDADHKIPLQNTPGIERVRILGDHKQIQRNEHQRQHPEHIPGLRKIFVLDHPPHAVRRRIIGDGGKQPADRMIANHGPQTEPWRSLRLRQTGQHSGVDRS